MATLIEIQNKIKALENSDLTDSEIYRQLKAEEAKMGSPAAKAPAKAVAKAPAKAIITEELVILDVAVDQDSFEQGGQQFGAPAKPDVYAGVFDGIVKPTTKENQIWLVFKTDDERVLAQKKQQVKSIITVTPMGKGAFKLKDILDGLQIAYDNSVSGKVLAQIPRGLPCMLDYQEVVLDGKTQIRLQNVWKAEAAQSQAV